MNGRIIYLNTFSWGTGHEMFNASMLWLCGNSPDKEVICRATPSNFKAMEHVLERAGSSLFPLKNRPVRTLAGEGRYQLLARYLWGAWLVWWHLVWSVRKQDVVIVPFNNLFAVRGINFLCRVLGRKAVVFCHGEMEFIASQVNRRGLLSKLLSRRCQAFFLDQKVRIAHGLSFSVLGDCVRDNLKVLLPASIAEKLCAFDHPYLFGSLPKLQLPHKPLLLGTCGAMNYSKGAQAMAQFAAQCQKQGIEVSITHVGKVFGGLEELFDAGVLIPSSQEELLRLEYDRLVGALDCLLFFYGSDNYKITASGAVMDALALGKPIVALRNDYFSYLFEKFGAFGTLCDSVEDMVAVFDRGGWQPTVNFEAIRMCFSPRSLQEEFNVMVGKI